MPGLTGGHDGGAPTSGPTPAPGPGPGCGRDGDGDGGARTDDGLLDRFLHWLAHDQGRAPNTVAAYGADLAAYRRWLAARGMASAGEAGEDAVRSYVAALEAAGRKPSSVARALAAIRALHRYLGSDAARTVAAPAVAPEAPDVLDDTEVARLLRAMDGEEDVDRRDRALVAVLLRAGLRTTELVNLDVADVGPGEGVLTVEGAGGRVRVVPLDPPAMGALDAWLAARGRRHGPLFPNARGARLTRQGAWAIVQARGRRAGLGERVTPQALRHTCAARLLAGGLPARRVQQLLGQATATQKRPSRL